MTGTIETIKEMRVRGKSIREIAKIMGKSAGSISGIMSRNRDVFPITDTQMSMLKEVGRQKKSSNAIRKMFHETLNPPGPPPKLKENSKEYDESRLPGFTLWELEKKQCHWPLNEGGPFLFCGEVKAGKNYCLEHQTRSVRAV